jgi:hypothetical protein
VPRAMRLLVCSNAPPRDILTIFILAPEFKLMPCIEGTSERLKRGHCLVPGPENSLILGAEPPVDPVRYSMAIGCLTKSRHRFDINSTHPATVKTEDRFLPFSPSNRTEPMLGFGVYYMPKQRICACADYYQYLSKRGQCRNHVFQVDGERARSAVSFQLSASNKEAKLLCILQRSH